MKKNHLLFTVPIFILLTSHFASAQEARPEVLLSEAAQPTYVQQIKTLSANSSCSQYSWKNRGDAPLGYVKGMALSFARSLCRARLAPLSGLAKIMTSADTRDERKDAFAHYQNIFYAKGITTSTPGEDAVRAVYTLGLGLGMRESSGAYCEGWDVSAGSHRSSAEAEAGLFQVSFDSMGAAPELRKLYQEYEGTPGRCLLEVFKQGASCRPQSILGTGAGARYQSFNKACPAFAAEYAMAMLRLQRSHFGPINRREAEVNLSCESLLKKVQRLIDADPETACRELY
ncbi:MAG: hypothetical protein ACXWRA_14430 [Pseudobdellovibrionaceae bacterium]